MAFLTKVAVLSAGLALSAAAFADNLVGNWQTYEDGQPKAVVKISENGGTFTGVVLSLIHI